MPADNVPQAPPVLQQCLFLLLGMKEELLAFELGGRVVRFGQQERGELRRVQPPVVILNNDRAHCEGGEGMLRRLTGQWWPCRVSQTAAVNWSKGGTPEWRAGSKGVTKKESSTRCIPASPRRLWRAFGLLVLRIVRLCSLALLVHSDYVLAHIVGCSECLEKAGNASRRLVVAMPIHFADDSVQLVQLCAVFHDKANSVRGLVSDQDLTWQAVDIADIRCKVAVDAVLTTD